MKAVFIVFDKFGNILSCHSSLKRARDAAAVHIDEAQLRPLWIGQIDVDRVHDSVKQVI
jgi:hypothetical protein